MTCFLKFPFLLGVFCLRGPGGVQMHLRCLVWVCVWRWVREAPGPRGQCGNPSVTGLHRLQVLRLLPHRSPGPGPSPEPSGPSSPLGSSAALDNVWLCYLMVSALGWGLEFQEPPQPPPQTRRVWGAGCPPPGRWAGCLLCLFGPAPGPASTMGRGRGSVSKSWLLVTGPTSCTHRRLHCS